MAAKTQIFLSCIAPMMRIRFFTARNNNPRRQQVIENSLAVTD
jgi:hypothetical protein